MVVSKGVPAWLIVSFRSVAPDGPTFYRSGRASWRGLPADPSLSPVFWGSAAAD